MTVFRCAAILAIVCALAVLAFPQGPAIGGVWYGTISPNRKPARVSLIFQAHGEEWVGALMLGDGRAIPLKDVTRTGEQISFAIDLPQMKAVFKGALTTDGAEIAGEVTQNGGSFPLKVRRDRPKPAEPPAPPMDPRELIEMMTSMQGPLSERPFVPPVDYPPIGYGARPSHDPIAQLIDELDAGKVHLSFEKEQGYLHSVLDALHIPVESQMAVFSKTSVQAQAIGPGNPRLLYFNDSVVVGSVRGGFIEIASQDPEQGANFYTLLQLPVDKPLFLRQESCLGCHLSRNSMDIPGMLVRSVYPASTGDPINPLGSYLLDHRTPFGERWGGWYVTGNSGTMHHLGNAFFSDADKPESMVTAATQSDIVALMVFDHQMHMMNLITRVGWDYRLAASLEANDVIEKQLRDDVAEFVDYLLFVNEATLPDKIQGMSGFAEKFAALGPMDAKGRSLRQFDLEHRLMRYRCSYMIYSQAFDGMPDRARKAIYARIREVLGRFPAADRDAVLEILHDTKKDF